MLMPTSIVYYSAKGPIVYRPAYREEALDPYKRTLQLDDVTDGGLGWLNHCHFQRDPYFQRCRQIGYKWGVAQVSDHYWFSSSQRPRPLSVPVSANVIYSAMHGLLRIMALTHHQGPSGQRSAIVFILCGVL